MLFLIQFRDDPQKLSVRQKWMAKHLEFLRSKEESIRVAGSMRQEIDDAPVGGCWIVEAPNYAAARAVYADDPFWTEGLRSSVEVVRLVKAFPEDVRSV